MTASSAKLAINRKATAKFIADDPAAISLIYKIEQSRPGGAKAWIDGSPPRDPQDFKIIWPGGDGIVVTAEGKTRRFDFIIVGKYDAIMAIGDHWTQGESPQTYEIEYLFPYNGYEVKGGGVSHGSAPVHG